MAGGKSNSSDSLMASQLEAQSRTLEALMKLLDGSEGIRGGRRVDIDLKGPRPPSEMGFAVPVEAPGWPAAPLPKPSMRPPPGLACASLANSSAAVIGVALFGLSESDVEQAVKQIAARQRLDMNFIPIFMTDVPNQEIFRRFGYLAEYFPTGTYGHATDHAAFHDKFELVWRKWGVGSLIDLSASGGMRTRVDGSAVTATTPDRPVSRRRASGKMPTSDIAALRADYLSRGLDREPDTFVLYRIIGNDLYPRHRRGQVAENIRFILDHEPQLPDCEKRWVVNRIIDPEQESLVIAMLDERGHSYIHLPFDWEEYRNVEWDFDGFPSPGYFLRGKFNSLGEGRRARTEVQLRRKKNNYVMNNNGARNAALREGRGRAKWILPWDGNCFLTSGSWNEIRDGVARQAYLKYFVVPMARLTDNLALLEEGFKPPAADEPQILFRRDASEEFDESFPYGRRPKVELMWRLGVPGDWDNWHDDPWDPPRPRLSEEAGAFGRTGWVARLFSGHALLEAHGKASLKARGLARVEAIQATLDYLDEQAARKIFRYEALTAFDESILERISCGASDELSVGLLDRLTKTADLALERKPYSVVDKTTLPPSRDPHDYWHPAPYWWPNPETADGLPYVYKDGERAPGTRLYEPESEKYDRTRLQRLFDDAIVLALAWRTTGRIEYAAHAAAMVRRWFIHPESAMNPHLRYAQVQVGHGNEGQRFGVIEMKDLYYFLDAVRLLEQADALDRTEIGTFRDWLRKYLDWLRTSPQGNGERRANNNHGTCYDLQVGSIAAYLDDVPLLLSTLRTSDERIFEQFDAAGQQPHEMIRTLTAHYCCFNLQSWVNLSSLAASCGHPLWQFPAVAGSGMRRGFEWLLPHMNRTEWPYPQIEPFDSSRFAPLFLVAKQLYKDDFGVRADVQPKLSAANPLYYPHDGIKPFWQFGNFMGQFFPASTPAKTTARKAGAGSEVDALLDYADRSIDELGHIRAASEAPPFIFAIPLKSKLASPNWTEVEELLGRTLSTVLAQTDDNFLVYVAGHEKPAIAQLDHPKVTWLPVDFAPPDEPEAFMGDRNAKRRTIAAHIGKLNKDCFLMPLDADDWVHRRTVEFVRKKGFGFATLLGAGFVVNLQANSVWSDKSADRPFYKIAGSSAVFFSLEKADFPASAARGDVDAVKFRATLTPDFDYPVALGKRGMTHKVVDIPLVAYVRGHGNNNTKIKRGAEHNNRIGRNAEPITDRFRQSFVF